MESTPRLFAVETPQYFLTYCCWSGNN